MKLRLSRSSESHSTRGSAKNAVAFEEVFIDLTDEQGIREFFSYYVYSPFIFTNGHCKKENATEFTAIILDVDQGLTMDDARRKFSDLIYLIHTTSSHRKDIPNKGGIQDRFRIVLPLAHSYPISDWEFVRDTIERKYKFVDKASLNISRKFFPFLAGDANAKDYRLMTNLKGQHLTFGPMPGKMGGDQTVVMADGNSIQVRELKEYTVVHCPFHDDKHPSAFVKINDKGKTFLHCSVCNRTWWMENEAEEGSLSMHIDDNGCFFDQGIRNGKPAFLKYDSAAGTIEFVDTAAGRSPIPFDWGQTSRTVLFADGAENYQSLSNLLNEIVEFGSDHVAMKKEDAFLAACYVVMTYFADQLHSFPYLRFMGDTGSGKSLALQIYGKLCFRAWYTTSPSIAAMVRMLTKWKPTPVLDEFDLTLSDEAAEMIKLMNCGYERESTYTRADLSDQTKLMHYDVFSPKLIATRKRFNDQALESRCLTIQMLGSGGQVRKNYESEEREDRQAQLRRKLQRLRMERYLTFDPDTDVEQHLEGLVDRTKQLMKPLFIIFSDDREATERLVEMKGLITSRQKEAMRTSEDGEIVQAMYNSWQNDQFKIYGDHIRAGVREVAEAVGSRYPRRIGKILRAMGLEISQKQIEGKIEQRIVYNQALFETVFTKYAIDKKNLSVDDIQPPSRDLDF